MEVDSNEELSLEKKIERGFKRMAIIVIILSIIPMPIIFFLEPKNLNWFVVLEMGWTILVILNSYKLVKFIWKE